MWGQLLPIAGSPLGGLFGNDAIGDADEAQREAYEKAMAEWNGARGRVEGLWGGYQGAGNDALARQQAYLNGDASGFENSADYKFAVDQGENSLSRLAAARGNYRGGGFEKDMLLFGQNAANRFGNDYWNKLQGRAQMGMGANNALTQFNAQGAGSIADLLVGQGENTANSRIAQGRNTQDMFGSIGGMLGNWLGGR